MDIHKYLEITIKNGASDLHLKANSVPILRIDGALVPIKGEPPLTAKDTQDAFEDLADKPQMLLLTKADIVQAPDTVERVRGYAAETGQRCRLISAVSGEGLQELIREVGSMLDELRAADPDELERSGGADR